MAAALAHGAPVQQQPQRPPAVGTRLLLVPLARALPAFPPEMLQVRLQLPVAQRVPSDPTERAAEARHPPRGQGPDCAPMARDKGLATHALGPSVAHPEAQGVSQL